MAWLMTSDCGESPPKRDEAFIENKGGESLRMAELQTPESREQGVYREPVGAGV